MGKSFVQFSLLLQDGRQVGVGGRELGKHLQRLEVEPRRVLDVALLPFDVGQVVQGVRVRRREPSKKSALVRNLFLSFFGRGRPPSWFDQLDAREAHQLKVSGIVPATGPDPFGNCMPPPRLSLRALCEPQVISFGVN